MNQIYEYHKLNNLVPNIPHMANKILDQIHVVFTEREIELYFDSTGTGYKIAHRVYGGGEKNKKNSRVIIL